MTERARAAGLGHVIAAQVAEWGGAALPARAHRVRHRRARRDRRRGRRVVSSASRRRDRPLPVLRLEQRERPRPAPRRRARRRREGAPSRPDVRVPRGEPPGAAVARRGTGCPGPEPLVAPIPYGAVHITADAFLPSGPMGRWPRPDRATRACARTRRVRRAWAARSGSTRTRRSSIRWRCRPSSSTPSRTRPGSTSPRPPRGSEWIDALATRARRVLDAARLDPPVLVHGDWRIENVNVAAGAVVAIYDWDSVCTEPEIFAVANAMVTHSVDWSRPVGEHFPAHADDPRLPHRLRDRTRRDVRRRPAPRHRGAHGVPPRLRCPVRARDLVSGGRRLTARAPAPPRSDALLTDGLAALDD